MSSFVVGGGQIDPEGFLKPFFSLFRPGYARALNVTQRGSGANLSVDVNVSGGLGACMVETPAGVSYFGWIDATANPSVTTPDPSNPRVDTVVAFVDLTAISTLITNNVGALKFKVVPGTAGPTPSAPNSAAIQSSIGTGNPYTILANVAIGTPGSYSVPSSIVNANITDTRLVMALTTSRLYGGSNNTQGHLVPNTADGVVVTTPTGGITTTDIAAEGMTAFTPGWTNFGIGTAGNINVGGFKSISKMVDMKVYVKGGTGSGASGSVILALPVPADITAAGQIIGEVIYNTFHGLLVLNDANTAIARWYQVSGTGQIPANIGASSPVGFPAAAEMFIKARYSAA